MRRLATITLIALLVGAAWALPARAQTLAPEPAKQDAVTPAEMDQRLEDAANRLKPQKAARVAFVDFAWPSDPAEYKALAKFIVVLVVAVSQDEKELPLKRVYIEAKGRSITLQRLGSERRAVPADAAAHVAFGRYREDSFYLAPAGPMMRAGELLADFAVNRSGFRLYALPGTPPDFVRNDRNPEPARGARPDPKALKAFIEREYAGFPLPAGLR